MSYTAHDTIGFERKYNKTGFPANPVFYEGKHAEEFKKGDLVSLVIGIADDAIADSGLAVKATDSTNPTNKLVIVGVAAEAKTIDRTKDEKRYIKVTDILNEVYTVSFMDHLDVTAAAAGNAAGAFAADIDLSGAGENRSRGSLLYVYEGPAMGDIRVITGHTQANPAVFSVTPDFSATPVEGESKAIITCSHTTTTAETGAMVGSQLKLGDGDRKVSVEAPAAQAGFINVLSINPRNLTMDVMISPANQLMAHGRQV